MNTPELMSAIAQRLMDEIPELKGASYPAKNKVPESPWAMILEGSMAGPSEVKREHGRYLYLPQITIRVLVVSHFDRPRESTKIDSLIDPILDALNPDIYGGSVNRIMPGLSGHVDRLWDRSLISRGMTTEYSGEFCYAADIILNPKFKRTMEVKEL